MWDDTSHLDDAADGTTNDDCDGGRQASMQWQFVMRANLYSRQAMEQTTMSLASLMAAVELIDSFADDGQNDVNWHATMQHVGGSSDVCVGDTNDFDPFDQKHQSRRKRHQ